MKHDMTRREFVKQATLAGGLAALGGVWTEGEARASRSPNEMLRTAHIGVGGMGGSDLNSVSADPLVKVVALCDVDEARAAGSFVKFPDARKYADFRRMLDEMHKEIDAVVVSTPDHMHAPAAMMAIRMGKHVYCQKPLARTVSEVRAMQNAARKHRVVTQMGTQAHPSYARTVELIRAGAIGKVSEVHVITDRPGTWWNQGMTSPPPGQTPPASLNWDLWLGVQAPRDYSPEYLPFKWRGWWDFGTGAIGDMACHLADGAYWALDLQYPSTVEAVSGPFSAVSPPAWSVIKFEYPRRGGRGPVKLVWYDGGKTPPAEVLEGVPALKEFNGSLFIGDKGKLLAPHNEKPRLLPEKQFDGYVGPSETIPRTANHYHEWTAACRANAYGKTGSTFDYSCPLTESMLLGNVAIRVGRKFEYDARRMRAKGCPEADQFIRHQYRSGYSL
jgi:predicted dehydrogenase